MHKSVIPVSAVLMVAFGALLTSSCSKTGNVLAATSDVPTVAVARTTTENLSRDLILTAEFRPFQEVDVMAKVAGYIKQINVDVGDRVKQGDPLATLEIPEMADDQRRASAALERSQAEVARAGDELQRAESAHDIAHLSLQRLAAVAEKRPGLIAQQEIDDARSKDLVAEAQVAAAKSALAAATDQVHVNTADLAEGPDDARLYPRHRAVHRSGDQAVCRYGLHDPGRNRVANPGHARGPALGKQPAAARFCRCRSRLSPPSTSVSRWKCGFPP